MIISDYNAGTWEDTDMEPPVRARGVGSFLMDFAECTNVREVPLTRPDGDFPIFNKGHEIDWNKEVIREKLRKAGLRGSVHVFWSM